MPPGAGDDMSPVTNVCWHLTQAHNGHNLWPVSRHLETPTLAITRISGYLQLSWNLHNFHIHYFQLDG